MEKSQSRAKQTKGNTIVLYNSRNLENNTENSLIHIFIIKSRTLFIFRVQWLSLNETDIIIINPIYFLEYFWIPTSASRGCF